MSQIFVPGKVRNFIKRQPMVKPKQEQIEEIKELVESKNAVCAISEAKKAEVKKVAPAIKKEYNKTYYKKHMEEHKAKHKIKVACELCGRVVNKQNLQAHKGRSRCINRQEILKFQKDLVKMYPLPKPKLDEKYSFINYDHIQRGLDLIDLISKSFKK